MEFTNTKVKEDDQTCNNTLAQLSKSLDRTLLQWDALESYFLSEFEDNDETKDDDKVN